MLQENVCRVNLRRLYVLSVLFEKTMLLVANALRALYNKMCVETVSMEFNDYFHFPDLTQHRIRDGNRFADTARRSQRERSQ